MSFPETRLRRLRKNPILRTAMFQGYSQRNEISMAQKLLKSVAKTSAVFVGQKHQCKLSLS